jgi:hypothetical protein
VNNRENLGHTTWGSKYHSAWISRYQKRPIYGYIQRFKDRFERFTIHTSGFAGGHWLHSPMLL